VWGKSKPILFNTSRAAAPFDNPHTHTLFEMRR
jgi:hypothetical protein